MCPTYHVWNDTVLTHHQSHKSNLPYKRWQHINVSSIRRVQCTTIWFSRPLPSRMSQCLQGKHCIAIRYLLRHTDHRCKRPNKMNKQTQSLNISFLAGLGTEWTEIQVTLGGRTMPRSNLKTIACRLLYLVLATTLLHWVTIPCMFISDVPQKYTGLVYFSVLCLQLTVLYWYLRSNVS